MKKQILVVGITLLLLAVGFSGCQEKSSEYGSYKTRVRII